MINELAVQRRRQGDLAAQLTPEGLGANLGSPVIVGQTTDDEGYPRSARSVYKLDLFLLGGDQKEGAVPTFTALNISEYAANVGSTVPPIGTYVRLDLARGGRRVFTY
ncbi:MAG: hypothetical protein P4L84_33065 [Isosphaeraceae bacterium]|nr:hypothetical protein [Isosphaeraceae bacterium]